MTFAIYDCGFPNFKTWTQTLKINSLNCGKSIFDQIEPNSTFTPFGAVIGMFDPSARPCVPGNTLSFAVPMIKLIRMIDYMEESFLITDTWETVKKRITS